MLENDINLRESMINQPESIREFSMLATQVDQQADVVLTFDELIRRILAIEFGPAFVNNKGFEQMVRSIKRGLAGYMQDGQEEPPVMVH